MHKRIYWMDMLRITALVCVMLMHSVASFWYTTPITEADWHIFNFYDGLIRFCVPVFIMISGCMFLHPDKEMPTGLLYKKYIPRIVCAYLFWSLCYAVTPRLPQMTSLHMALCKEILWDVIGSHHHLWFCCTIVGLYIITPLLRKITTDRRLSEYFLAAAFLFGILLPTLQKFPLLSYTTLITDKANLFFFGGYTFYFVLGYYLYVTALSKKAVRLIYLCGILAAVVTIAGTAFLSMANCSPVELLYGYLTPNVALQACAVFVFFKETVSKAAIKEKCGKLLIRLSALTFGMYLVHDFFNILFQDIGLTAAIFTPVLSVPLITAAVFLCSFLVTYILDKLPLIRKCI